ncbi:response regulator [Caldinitratiruptor microaerophilus]|uniref:Stage 0 sporulation protein A homolog n=1 Tax=Caldinitratiruptor microaerophilus TaxID=671077 RepID=A0AA35CMY8_9FIRM|nr:response regulator [Caldinitratiruptor microaerophilus]BDG61358.1 response regulator [Caldinitratiruptor microaerophilus]
MAIQRILLVEDDPDIQKMASLALRHTAGAEVFVACDGASALRQAREKAPDVVLLDVMLPDMDGYEVCRRLKADPATRAIPVIFLSARAQQKEIEQGLGLGAAGYLVKPFDPMTLASEIERLVKG